MAKEMWQLLLFLVMATTVASRVAGTGQGQVGKPDVPFPYSTTLLRTHHYAAETFLSVGELLSVNQTDDGHVWEAFMIAPGWPFDLRDDPENPTVVLGLRVVYEYDDPHDATQYTIWYYMTNLDGEEECVLHDTYALAPTYGYYAGEHVVRGIETASWVDVGDGGDVTTLYYTQDVDGEWYPFRHHFRFPEGSAEIEWTLDHGTHYPLLQSHWFDTSGCSEGNRSSSLANLAGKGRRTATVRPHYPYLF